MNTDKACEILSLRAEDKGASSSFKDACHFAIYRMRELDSMREILRSIVAEFKEAP